MDIEALISNIKYYLCCPLNSTCELQVWVEDSRLNYYDRNDQDYRKAISMVSRSFIDYTYLDFVNLYKESDPVWYARNSEHYYSREESLFLIEELLNFQFKQEEKADFINACFNVAEKLIPKKNTLHIHGPANSGKTYFTQMILAFYLNVGHIANFVRGQNFPLNDCTEKRILFWNEPSICPSSWDTVKMLTGGDPLPAKVKYSSDVTIPRTPVFINSNPSLFPPSDIWMSRIYSFRWKSAPFLKAYTKYPYPLCYSDLIEKYVFKK